MYVCLYADVCLCDVSWLRSFWLKSTKVLSQVQFGVCFPLSVWVSVKCVCVSVKCVCVSVKCVCVCVSVKCVCVC